MRKVYADTRPAEKFPEKSSTKDEKSNLSVLKNGRMGRAVDLPGKEEKSRIL